MHQKRLTRPTWERIIDICPQTEAESQLTLGVRQEDLSNGNKLTTENEIETSVDAEVLSLDEQIAALQKNRTELATKQTEERAEKQREAFDEIIGGSGEILEATGIDMDALKAIGVIGFILQTKPDAGGGPDYVSVAPVTAVAAKPKASSGGGSKPSRPLQANFDANANADERAAMAKIVEAGADGNKVFALRVKVYDRVNPS